MEEVKEMQHKEKENMGSVTKTDEKISSESTGEVTNVVSDSGAAVKPSEEPKARFNRMKLFNKVMQKSLEKFIEHARFVNFSLIKTIFFHLFITSFGNVKVKANLIT